MLPPVAIRSTASSPMSSFNAPSSSSS
ncbi:Hypothetical protein NocV09_06900190, partial [Nannochloropsis oceanica]